MKRLTMDRLLGPAPRRPVPPVGDRRGGKPTMLAEAMKRWVESQSDPIPDFIRGCEWVRNAPAGIDAALEHIRQASTICLPQGDMRREYFPRVIEIATRAGEAICPGVLSVGDERLEVRSGMPIAEIQRFIDEAVARACGEAAAQPPG